MNTWIFAYDGFDPEQEGLREALCTVGNGYFATRGAACEAEADGVHYPGTYVAGLYNRLSDEIEGRVIENESLVNVPNPLPLRFRPEGGEWFDLRKVEVIEYRQELELRRGLLTRSIDFRDGQGRETHLFERRFVSMADAHIMAVEWTIVPRNWSGTAEVRTALDGRVRNSGIERYNQLSNRHLETVRQGRHATETVYLEAQTNQSHVLVAEAARTRLHRNGNELSYDWSLIEGSDYVGLQTSLEVQQDTPLVIEKVVSLYTGRDTAISEPILAATMATDRAGAFEELLDAHVLAWAHLWNRVDMTVTGHEWAELVLRLHRFHLLQTASPNSLDLDIGVPPRGLHGEAYRGHIFWDELFIFRLLDLDMPELTRSLLLYRYRRLPEARLAATEAGYAGAMYPWQAGSDGREESQQLHLNPRSGRWIPDNSHIQRHVSIAIAYSVWQYYQATGDRDFLALYGAEMVIEIARFWASAAHYERARDRYVIHGIMGPDEYHDAYPDSDEHGLNNNAYTNVMAAWVMERAREILDILPAHRATEVLETIGLRQQEVEQWRDIATKMFVPFHDGVISQFEGYENLEEFDWEGYREKYGDIHRLDRILEAEDDTANRYKVSKQADVLMLFYLLSAEELRELFSSMGYELPPETILSTIEYYMESTAHGSTLSSMVHSWVLARSHRAESWRFFVQALESDVADVQGGTTREGIHLGAMAGTVDIIVRCYTGIELREDTLWLNPCLPDELDELEFSILYRGHKVDLRINHRTATVATAPGAMPQIKVALDGDCVELGAGATHVFELATGAG